MSTNSLENDILQLHSNLIKIGRNIFTTIRKKLKDTGISFNQFRILKKFKNTPKIEVKILLEEIKIKKGNLTRIIDKLVKMGYVIRGREELDRRKVFVEITKEGSVYLNQLLEKEKKFVLEFYKNIPSTRIPVILELLNEFEQNLEVSQ
jgi:DNA-binding MarR family transcriptional regulator